jgi:hypothetical protein
MGWRSEGSFGGKAQICENLGKNITTTTTTMGFFLPFTILIPSDKY